MSDISSQNDKLSEFNKEVGRLATSIEEMKSSDKSRRIQILVLAISIFLDLGLSIGMFVALDNTNKAQDKTDALVEDISNLNNQARVLCKASNESAASQHLLWEGVIAQQDPNDPTDPKKIKQFLDLLDKTFPQRECK